MTYLKSVLIFVFLSLASASFVGCGSGQADFVPIGTVGGLVDTTSPFYGKVSLGRSLGGGTAVAQSLDGSVLARSTLSESGNFIFRDIKNFPTNFRIRVYLDGISLPIFSEVRDRPGLPRFYVANVPTTLASLYVQANPGASLQEAEDRVRASLGIPSGLNLGYGIEESGRSSFSHLAFFVEASEAGGVEALLSQLVAESTIAGQEVGAPRFKLRKSHFTASLSGLEPLLAERIRFLQSSRVLELSVVSGAVDVLGFVGKGVASSVLDAGIDTAWTKFAEQVGLNFGSTVLLDELVGDMNMVLEGIVSIENQITNSEYNTDVTTLADEVAYIEALSGSGAVNGGSITEPGASTALTSYESALSGDLDVNTPWKPSTTVTDFLSYLLAANNNVLDVSAALTEIANLQIGDNQTTSMNTLWREVAVDEVLATTVNPKNGNFPVRSNYWVDIGLQNFNYYAAYQRLGANWLVEAARQQNDLAGSVNEIIPTLQSVAASLTLQRGQFPYYQISDNMLADLNAGLIWYLEVQGPDTYFNGIESPPYVQGTGPSGETVTLTGWRFPTKEEVRYLCDRARFCKGPNISGEADAETNSNDGYGDYGAVTLGLQKLGFKNVRGAFSSSDNGGNASDGGMWYLSFKIEGDTWGQIAYAEMQINHASDKLKQKGDDDKRPYIFVRSIGETLNDPEGRTSNSDSIYQSGTGTPVYLNTISLQDAEYPALGTCTEVTSSGNLDFEKFVASLKYQIVTGLSVTIGDSSNDEDRSLTETTIDRTLSTASGGQLNALQNLVTFVSSNTSLIMSNMPPAFDPADGDSTFLQALNQFGPVGSLIWQVDDSGQTLSSTITLSTLGYNGSSFPATLTATGSTGGRPVDNSGAGRAPVLLQVSPRNRVYDSSFGTGNATLVSETYGASLFYDNESMASRGLDATWELVNVTNLGDNTPYGGSGLSLTASGTEAGFLQANLEEIPESGISFQVRATLSANGQTFTDTVNCEAYGIP